VNRIGRGQVPGIERLQATKERCMTVGITELPPEGMLLPGVALAGDAERGTKTTEGISLLFTAAGVTVQGPQPQIERLLVWSALDSAACREVVQLADGRDAAIMELTSGGQSIRFLLPSDTVSPGQAAYLDQALPTWLARYRGAPVPTAAAPAPVAAQPAAEAPIGVELPAPGPTAAPAPSPEQAPAPSFATAGIAAAGATALAPDPSTMSPSNGTGPAPVAPMAAPAQFAAPPPPAPVDAPVQYAAPPPPAPVAPTQFAAPAAPADAPAQYAAPPPPPPPAPAAPVQYATPAVAPPPPVAMQAPMAEAPVMAPPPGTGWDNPPLGGAVVDPPAPEKTAWYKLAPRKPKAAAPVVAAAAPAVAPAPPTAAVVEPPAPEKAAWYKLAPRKPKAATTAAAVGAADLAVQAQHPDAPPVAGAPQSYVAGAPQSYEAAPVAPGKGLSGDLQAPPKKPRFTMTRKKAATAAAAGAGAAAVVATAGPEASVFDGIAGTTQAPPPAPTGSAVPLAVQPPAPVQGGTAPFPPTTYPIVPGGDPADYPPGGATPGGAVVDGGAKSNRRVMVLLVALILLVVVGGGAYFVSKKSNTPTPAAAPTVPVPTTASDTALATAINLHLADLPTGWTQAPPAQAVVRPPVASVAAQTAATNTMASCLFIPASVVSGLFGSGFLPGQTSLVQSPTFLSPAGSSFEMASRTSTLATTAQVTALEAVLGGPRFTACYQQYAATVAAAAVPGATVAVLPVALTSPAGVRSFGVVSTYTLPGTGTEVVGDAYILGGRVLSVLQPSTNGPAIPGSVFTPAYNAVAGRVAAASRR
jgi:hypothetical protein